LPARVGPSNTVSITNKASPKAGLTRRGLTRLPDPQVGGVLTNPLTVRCDPISMIYLRSKRVPARPSMASVHGRAEVDRIAPFDPARALTLAHAIPDA
jgi:hypothetical protein